MKKVLFCLLTIVSLAGCSKTKYLDEAPATKQDESEQIDKEFEVTPDVVYDDSESANQNAYVEGNFADLLNDLNEQFNSDGTYITTSKEALIDMYTLSDDIATDAIAFLSSEDGNYNCIYLFEEVTNNEQLQNMFDEVYGAIEATYSENPSVSEIPYQNIELNNIKGFAVGDKEFITSVCELVDNYINGGVTNE